MKDKCLAFMEDLNSKDLQRLSEWFHEDSRVWIPPALPVTGASRIVAMFRVIFRKYQTLSWKVTEVHELGDNSCLYLSESWGYKNESPYTNQIATDIIFDRQGRINQLSDYFKDTSTFV